MNVFPIAAPREFLNPESHPTCCTIYTSRKAVSLATSKQILTQSSSAPSSAVSLPVYLLHTEQKPSEAPSALQERGTELLSPDWWEEEEEGGEGQIPHLGPAALEQKGSPLQWPEDC